MQDLNQGNSVQIKATQQEATITGSEINTSGHWFYLAIEGEPVWNEVRKCNYFLATELEELEITITYVNAMHERLECGGKKSHTYPMVDKELAALHFYQLFNSPYKYKNLESTFDFETIKISF